MTATLGLKRALTEQLDALQAGRATVAATGVGMDAYDRKIRIIEADLAETPVRCRRHPAKLSGIA